MKIKLNTFLLFLGAVIFLSSCNFDKNQPDAQGVFEANEVIVSAEAMGQIIKLNFDEGSVLVKDSVVGKIDPENLILQKDQASSSVQALQMKTNDAGPAIAVFQGQLAVQKNQINIIQTQLNTAIRDKDRIQKLVTAKAAPSKQLDDIIAQVAIFNSQLDAAKAQSMVIEKQIKSQKESVSIQNRGILSEKLPMQKKIALVEDQLAKTYIVNPTNGTVLTKYVEQGEYAVPGKALYKIADLSTMTLRAYITSNQLGLIKLNQKVNVLIDQGDKKSKSYQGAISWISNQAEFTPKTIQTKEERANLVYAIKILVPNDGFLKIGMYADVMFDEKSHDPSK